MRSRVVACLSSVAVIAAGGCGDDGEAQPDIDASVPDAGFVTYEPSNLSADDFVAVAGNLFVGAGETLVLSSDDLTVEMHGMGTGVPRVQDQPDDSQIAVFRYRSIQIDGTLEITGDRMVALIAAENASVDGTILFPDGAALACGLVTTGVVPGGGGGGFGSVGGTGGNAGGAAGATRGTDTLIPLTPGCSGGPGIGAGTSEGGFGGGAIQISVGGTFSLGGMICASGGGGESVAGTGGGGGGSGGAILIEARDLAFGSRAGLIANGGGGGGGGAANTAGQAGGNSCTADLAAGGAAGGGLSGAGGNGGVSAGVGANGESGVNQSVDAGGGAGGGVGRIRINTESGSAPTNVGEFSGTVTQGALTLL